MKNFLIICGGSPTLIAELPLVSGWDRFDFMLVGANSPAEKILKTIHHHVSHENDFPVTEAVRRALGFNVDYETWSNRPHPGVRHVLSYLTPPTCSFECRPRLPSKDPRNHHHYSGSSAMLGLKVGLRLGYSKIVLAGVSLESGHYVNFQVGWLWIADLLRCCPVRSLGGFPATFLGTYSEEWLNA